MPLSHPTMADLTPIWQRDRATLAGIARTEQLRQVRKLRQHGKDAGAADQAWAEIVLWLEHPGELPEDPRRTYGHARRLAELVRASWAKEADQSNANPKVPMFLGLLQIERLLLLHWGHLMTPERIAA